MRIKQTMEWTTNRTFAHIFAREVMCKQKIQFNMPLPVFAFDSI
jgi:hypothetical protein